MKEVLNSTTTVISEITLASCDSLRVFIKKAASRKLLVWVFATHMTYLGILDPNLWFAISSIFLGLQGAIDYKTMTSNFIQKSEQTPAAPVFKNSTGNIESTVEPPIL